MNNKDDSSIAMTRRRDSNGVSPAKLTTAAFVRMEEEFGFDPLAEAIAIASGDALTKDHPLLPILDDHFTNWKKRIALNKPITIDDIDRLEEKCIAALTDSWVEPSIRAGMVKELLGYIYPKRKSVEYNHGGNIQEDMSMKTLTKEEAGVIIDVFEDKY